MKYRNLIIILIIIIGLHVLFVSLFVRSGAQGEVETEPPTEPENVEATADSSGSVVSKTNESRASGRSSAAAATPTRAGKSFASFNYDGAVVGSKGLPAGVEKAKTGFLVDMDTGKVLWSKNAKKAVPIASMTKMMTALLAFEAVDNRPDVSLDTPIKVTKSAYKIGGSQVWLDPKETFPLGELLKSVQIKSANDSAELIAEFLGGGDADVFIAEMNRKANAMGLLKTRFHNPHGLPGEDMADENVSSCEDLARLANELLKYPTAVKWASTWLEYFRKGSPKPTMLTNHNRLIKDCEGVDGMKTGYTKRAGFCTTVTCKRGGKRLIAVVTGFPSWRERDKFVRKLLDWGYERVNR